MRSLAAVLLSAAPIAFLIGGMAILEFTGTKVLMAFAGSFAVASVLYALGAVAKTAAKNGHDYGRAAVTATRACVRLARRRVGLRYQSGLVFAAMAGTIFFLAVWGGFRGKFRPWGDPVSLHEAIHAFPIAAVEVFLGYVFWPYRHYYEDGW